MLTIAERWTRTTNGIRDHAWRRRGRHVSVRPAGNAHRSYAGVAAGIATTGTAPVVCRSKLVCTSRITSALSLAFDSFGNVDIL
jgi:transketolase C-terminal domain/subunit